MEQARGQASGDGNPPELQLHERDSPRAAFSLYSSWRAVEVWNIFRRCPGFKNPTSQFSVEIGTVPDVRLSHIGFV